MQLFDHKIHCGGADQIAVSIDSGGAGAGERVHIYKSHVFGGEFASMAKPLDQDQIQTDDDIWTILSKPTEECNLIPVIGDQCWHTILRRKIVLIHIIASEPVVVHAPVVLRWHGQSDATVSEAFKLAHGKDNGVRLMFDGAMEVGLPKGVPDGGGGKMFPIQRQMAARVRKRGDNQAPDAARAEDSAGTGGGQAGFAQPEFFQFIAQGGGSLRSSFEMFHENTDMPPFVSNRISSNVCQCFGVLDGFGGTKMRHQRGDQRVGAIVDVAGNLLDSLAGGGWNAGVIS